MAMQWAAGEEGGEIEGQEVWQMMPMIHALFDAEGLLVGVLWRAVRAEVVERRTEMRQRDAGAGVWRAVRQMDESEVGWSAGL